MFDNGFVGRRQKLVERFLSEVDKIYCRVFLSKVDKNDGREQSYLFVNI